MPFKNGIDVVKEVRELYQDYSLDLPNLLDPEFVFLTGFMSHAFRKHLLSIGI